MAGVEDVNHYFRKAARVMDLSARIERLLVTPYREVKVDVSITLDSGETRHLHRLPRPARQEPRAP